MAARPWPPTSGTPGRCRPGTARVGRLPVVGAGHLRHRSRRPRTGRPQWIEPGAAHAARRRPTSTPTPARTSGSDPSPIVRAMAYVSADQQYQLHVDGAHWSTPARPSATPTRSTTRPPTSRRWLRAGARQRRRPAVPLVRLGKGRPAGRPAPSPRSRCCTPTAPVSCWPPTARWKVARAPWLASTPRNLQGDPVDHDREHRRSARARRLGPARLRRPGLEPTPPQSAVRRSRPGPTSRAPGPRDRVPAARRPDAHPAGRRHLRGRLRRGGGGRIADRAASTRARRAHRSPCTPATCSTPTARCRPPGRTQATDMSYSYVERGRCPDLPRLRLPRLPLPADRRSGRDADRGRRRGADPPRRRCPTAPPPRFASSDRTLDDVWDLAAHSAVHRPGAVHRHTDPREGAVPARRLQRVRDGHGRVRRAGPDPSRPARVRRSPRRATGPTVGSTPSTRAARALATSPTSPRSTPSGCGATELATGDRRCWPRCTRRSWASPATCDRAIDPATGLVTDLPGGGDGDYQYGIVDWPAPMRYGYDMATAARTTVNVMAVDAFDRVAQLGAALGRPTAARWPSSSRGPTALTAAVNRRLDPTRRHLRRRPRGRTARQRLGLAARQRRGAGLRGRARRASGHGGRLRRPPGHADGTDDGPGPARRPPPRRPRPGPRARCVTDAAPAGLGQHPGPGRHLHLGDLGAVGRRRRQHVARLGVDRPRRPAAGPGRREPHRTGRVDGRRAAPRGPAGGCHAWRPPCPPPGRGIGALAVRARRLGHPRPDRAPQHHRHRVAARPTRPPRWAPAITTSPATG